MNQIMVDILAYSVAHPNEYVDAYALPGHTREEIRLAVTAMRSNGLLSRDMRSDGCWIVVNSKGVAALLEAQEADRKAAEKVADDKRKEEHAIAVEKTRRRDLWLQFFLGLLIGWLLGAFTPIDLWGAAARLIGKITSLFSH